MMSDYERTMELVSAANDSAGSSQQQFDKTLDSMEAKLNQLQNTWQEFTLGLADSDTLKMLIDLLNGFLTVINKMTDAPGIIGSVSKAFLGLFSLFSGKKFFDVTTTVLTSKMKEFQTGGETAAMTWGQAFKKEFGKTGSTIQKTVSKTFGGLKLNTNDQNKQFKAFSSTISNYDQAVNKAAKSSSLLEAGLDKYGVKLEDLEQLENVNIGTTEKHILAQLEMANTFDQSDVDNLADGYQSASNAIKKIGEAYSLSADQSSEFLAFSKLGVSVDTAAAAAKSGLTAAQLRENAVEALGLGTKKELTEEEEKAIQAEMKKQVISQQSLALQLKEKVLALNKLAMTKLQTAADGAGAKAKLAQWLAQKLVNSEMALAIGIIALVVAAVALLAIGIYALVKAYQSYSQASENAAKFAESAATEAEEAAQAYDDLKDSIENLEGLENTLSKLEKGTTEWKKTVAELNQQVLSLLETYPFLADYINNSGGVLSIDDEGLDKLLEWQANQVEQKAAWASAATVGSRKVAESSGEDDISKFFEEAYENEAIKTLFQKNASSSQDSKKDKLKDLLQKQASGEDITDKDIAKIVLGAGSDSAAGVYLETYSDEIEAFKIALTGLSSELGTLTSAVKVTDETLLASVNDFSGYTDDESVLVTTLMSSEIGKREWTDAEGEVVKASNDKEIWAAYEEELKNQDDTYEYEVTNKLGDKAGVKRTKNGKTEWLNSAGEWQDEKDTEAISQKTIYNTLKTKKTAEFTDEDNTKIDNLLDTFNSLKASEQEGISKLVEAGLVTSQEIEKWGLEENDYGSLAPNDALASAIKEAADMFGNLDVLSADTTRQQTIAQSSSVVAQTGTALTSLIEDGSIEDETALLAALEQIDGLYDDLGTAAQEWAVVSNSGIVDQIDYLTKLSQQQQITKNNEIQNAKDLRSQLQAHLEENGDAVVDGPFKVDSNGDGKIDTIISSAEELEKTLESTDWVLDIEVTDNFDEVDTQVDNLISSFEKIADGVASLDENFEISAADAEELSAVFPGILENATVTTEGIIQLDEGQRESSILTAEEKIRAAAQAQQNILDMNIAELEAFVAAKSAELAVVKEFCENGNAAEKAALLVDLANEGEFAQAVTGIEQDILNNNATYQDAKAANAKAAADYEVEANDTAINLLSQGYADDIKNNANAVVEKTKDQSKFITAIKAAFEKLKKFDFSGAWSAFKSGLTTNTSGTYDVTLAESNMVKGIDEDKLTKKFDPVYREDGSLDSGATLSNYYNSESAKVQEALTQIKAYKDQKVQVEAAMNATIYKLKHPGGGTSSSSSTDSDEDAWEYERDYDENIKSKLSAAENEKSRLETELEGLVEDENASIEDIIDKKLEIAAATEKQLKLLQEQNELDVAEANRLQQQHLEWSKMYSIGDNGEITWDQQAINQLGLSEEQGEVFDEWSEQLTTAVENAAASTNDIAEKLNELNSVLQTIYNEFDETYNLQLKYNELEQERNKLEVEYNRLLSDGVKNMQLLVDNLEQQYETLKEQQKNLKSQLELAKLNLSTFMNREGNKQYQQYLVKDSESGNYSVNVAQMEKLAATGAEEAYEAVTEFLEQFFELQDEILDLTEDIRDVEEDYADLRQEGIEATDDLVVQVYEAIIEYIENQIDATEELYSAIDDSNSRLLSAINQSLELQRQERDNERTEGEINDMRNQLAYLQMDTSGANQNQIQTLQTQISEKEEDYTDTLIDQKINELERQNDLAAEQREREIDLLTWVHESSKNNGVYLSAANSVISNGLTNVEKGLISGEDIWTYFKNNDISETICNAAKTAGFDYTEAFKKIVPKDKTLEDVIKDNLKNEKGRMLTQAELNNEEQGWLKTASLATAQLVIAQQNYTAAEARIASRLAAGLEDAKKLTVYEQLIYDVNHDGKYTDEDAQLILEASVGKRKLKTGGLADFTGPAWLDGTKSRPEIVLNQQDTKNFLELKDVLSSFMSKNNFNKQSTEKGGDNYYEIHLDVEKITSDYDVEQLASKVKSIIAEDANSRGVNSIYRRR